jgi:hypothetical protein
VLNKPQDDDNDDDTYLVVARRQLISSLLKKAFQIVHDLVNDFHAINNFLLYG